MNLLCFQLPLLSLYINNVYAMSANQKVPSAELRCKITTFLRQILKIQRCFLTFLFFFLKR